MHKRNVKISGIILLFSLGITILFFLLMMVFQQQYASTMEGNSKAYYGVSYIHNSQSQELMRKGSLTITPDQLSSLKDLNARYQSDMISILIPLALGFCAFLFGASFLLWRRLNKIRKKEDEKIIHSLDSLVAGQPLHYTDEGFLQVYKKIEERFQTNLDDFKRLNTYLSHEQKNTLALLRTQMEIEKETTYLDQIDYLTNSIDDVLTISDNEESDGIVDVSILCAEVCDLYQKQYEFLHFSFTDETTNIMAKPRWIFRALSNLIDNAMKYGENGVIEVSIEHTHACVIVKVQDFGIGIDEREMDRIFKNKYRVNELQESGYGIGLSLVSHVCDLCQGTVWVDSVLGEGSTFYLSFPSADA